MTNNRIKASWIVEYRQRAPLHDRFEGIYFDDEIEAREFASSLKQPSRLFRRIEIDGLVTMTEYKMGKS